MKQAHTAGQRDGMKLIGFSDLIKSAEVVNGIENDAGLDVRDSQLSIL